MDTENFQERKDRISEMEKQLRVSGQELDALWMEARNAKGQARTDLHHQIESLRQKLNKNRTEHEALKEGAPSR